MMRWTTVLGSFGFVVFVGLSFSRLMSMAMRRHLPDAPMSRRQRIIDACNRFGWPLTNGRWAWIVPSGDPECHRRVLGLWWRTPLCFGDRALRAVVVAKTMERM